MVLQGHVQPAPVCRLPHVSDDGVFQHVGQQDRQVLFFHSQLRRQLYGMRNRYPLLLGTLNIYAQRRVDDGVLAVRRQRGSQDLPFLRYNQVGGLFRFAAFNQRQQQPVIVPQVVTDAHDLFLPFPGEPGVIFQRVDALVHHQVAVFFPVLFFRTPHQDHHKTVKQEYPEGQHQPGQMVVPVVDDPVVGQQHHVAEPQAQRQERHIITGPFLRKQVRRRQQITEKMPRQRQGQCKNHQIKHRMQRQILLYAGDGQRQFRCQRVTGRVDEQGPHQLHADHKQMLQQSLPDQIN